MVSMTCKDGIEMDAGRVVERRDGAIRRRARGSCEGKAGRQGRQGRRGEARDLSYRRRVSRSTTTEHAIWHWNHTLNHPHPANPGWPSPTASSICFRYSHI